MAGKQNDNAGQIDLTSYSFAYMCGVCHPGGGPVEFDRNGNRYDKFAADPKNGITPGGLNGFDGDYFKSKWAESGVLEADCLLCHLKGYNNEARKEQIRALNFRWAATVGAGFGEVTGMVANGEAPQLTYNRSLFGKDGKISLPIIRETPNENCLFCHRESDWKKRGSSYSPRTDVHIRAGLRCVDCHLTARKAEDQRIKGKEEHQIGKGDDPGGFVRDDLDNTMRRCEDCHLKGLMSAPVIKHKGLPPIHLEKLACQTCHIPWRQVKAALVQDASVFNTTPRIAPPPKRIWSFYGPDMKPWNYYGYAFTYPEGLQPLFTFNPVVGWYKGKIYPLNRVYTLWVGIKKPGEKGIDQPHMKDVFMMWKAHSEDPEKNYPELKLIKDDNKDGFLEVNRSEEVKALLRAVSNMLKVKGKLPEGSKVVFVNGNRYTIDGIKWEKIPKKPYEYSPYGSVFKFSHDITPAKNALGANGCTDCHSFNASFWGKPVMTIPFDAKGKAHYESNFKFLGVSPLSVFLGALRQEVLKPILFYGILFGFGCLLLILVRGGWVFNLEAFEIFSSNPGYRLMIAILGAALLGPAIVIVFGDLISSPTIGVLETIHRWVGVGLILVTLWLLLKARVQKVNGIFWLGLIGVVFMGVSGMVLFISDSINIRQIVFALHDIGAILLTAFAAGVLIFAFLRIQRS